MTVEESRRKGKELWWKVESWWKRKKRWRKSDGLAQATSHVTRPLKIQAQAKAWESGLSKLKLEPRATPGHSFGSGSARLLLAGIGWLSAHGPGQEITNVAVAIDATKVTERGQLVMHDVVNRPPKIDDLKAPLLQSLYVVGREVASHTRDGRLSHLVDMHARDGLPVLQHVNEISRAPADGFVNVTRQTVNGLSAHF